LVASASSTPSQTKRWTKRVPREKNLAPLEKLKMRQANRKKIESQYAKGKEWARGVDPCSSYLTSGSTTLTSPTVNVCSIEETRNPL